MSCNLSQWLFSHLLNSFSAALSVWVRIIQGLSQACEGGAVMISWVRTYMYKGIQQRLSLSIWWSVWSSSNAHYQLIFFWGIISRFTFTTFTTGLIFIPRTVVCFPCLFWSNFIPRTIDCYPCIFADIKLSAINFKNDWIMQLAGNAGSKVPWRL